MNSIKQTGGTYDRANYPLYFISSNDNRLNTAGVVHPYVLIAADHFMTQTGQTQGTIWHTVEQWLDQGWRVFLDSGVFTVAMDYVRKSGKSFYDVLAMDPGQIPNHALLLQTYQKVLDRYGDRLWGYIEVDFGGAERKTQTRTMLEQKGYRPIPVFHPLTDPWPYFDELARQYDRICFANVVQSPREVRKRILMTLWQRKCRYPHLWVHVLGYTPDQLLNALPFESADSSTFLSAVRWGTINCRVAGKSAAVLPKSFNYNRADNAGEQGHEKATRMIGYMAAMQQRNWGNQLQHFQRIGGQLWPPDMAEAQPGNVEITL